MSSEEERRQRARKRAKEKFGFLLHLTIYIIINGFLWAQWALIGFGFPWPAFASLGWGIGLAFHFAGAWLGLGRGWIEKETQRILEQEK